MATFVYHMAEAVNWDSIRRDGLLSTRALLDRAGLDGAAREVFERHRPCGMLLPDGTLIRDQKPMPPAQLARCLDDGITPQDWYAALNARVFFWFDVERMNRQRRACGPAPQIVMTIDAEKLLERHGARAAVTPFNVGNARRKAARRGMRTLVRYEDWLENGWLGEARPGEKPRARSHRPAELTVSEAVRDVMSFVVDVRRLL